MSAAPTAGSGEPVGDGTVSVQWCSWHGGMARARPVEVIERGPGAGGTLYACRPCRIANNLEPLPTAAAWHAVFAHLAGTADTKPCASCNRHERCPEGAALCAEYRRQRKADQE
ncbi:hypothetical protein SUDANB6_03485 [Streptomyces sp. enrichment culture]|uniref:hypothetical protein n=1 Tax=Streptomyces sp. enrichment culture TaxID=1795815 RepID=UPI003F570F62